MKNKFLLITGLICLLAGGLFAVDANYYIRKANYNLLQVDNMRVDLRIRSRLPQATVPDRQTSVFFQRPDSLFVYDGKDLLIPREIFLLDLNRLTRDAKSLRVVKGDSESSQPVALIEAKKMVDGEEVIFLTMIDTVKWTLSQMKIIDKPEMIADVKFTQREVQPGIYLPSDIKVVLETKEQARKVPNPRGGTPVTSKFGYINVIFENYMINYLGDEK